MSNGSSIRTRAKRVAALRLPPGRLRRVMAQLRRNDVLLRVGMCLGAAACLWAVTAAWEPPLSFRVGDIPERDVMTRVPFEVRDDAETSKEIQRAREQARFVFQHDSKRAANFQALLFNRVQEVRAAIPSSGPNAAAWKEFLPSKPDEDMKQVGLVDFQKNLEGNERWEGFKQAIEAILKPLNEVGMLDDEWSQDEDLPKATDDPTGVLGNQREVDVIHVGHPEKRFNEVAIANLTVDHYKTEIQRRLKENPITDPIAAHIFYWLRDRLPRTLKFDRDATDHNRVEAAKKVKQQTKVFQAGQRLAAAGEPLSSETLELLKHEHERWLASAATSSLRLHRSASMFALIAGLFVLGGFYLYYRQPRLRQNVPHLTMVFALLAGAVLSARWLSLEEWRPEVIPLVLFGLIMAIAYGRELALLFSAALVGIVVLANARSVAEFLVLLGVVSTAVLLLTNIRTRVKLIEICSLAGAVACVLTIALGIFDGRPLEGRLLSDAVRLAFWTLVAGFVVTGLLPFIERLFGVLTDLSLLELSDVSHPLLQELVRRAPGTYNHSINVGALGEAAAEAIGARGLLVRVGAYFHDIGKMLKPAYFAENQGQENRHESLAPAMSTLIIIAHIKDGADLARQHKLPQSIIDFIEQHHGTTLVEYFYKRAEAESLLNPGTSTVEEGAFRYPGPKPQTREAAVLMLADAVESASRTLSDPAPARIESLVEEIVMKRLMDDQFDECAINLRELRTVQDSLVKSLIAVYHGRVKYPTQRTA
jgi:putative nucleotidyltransferase with HDIG domain